MNRLPLLLALLAACGAPARPPIATPPTATQPAGPRPPERVQLTILTATIDGRKPDGTTWDDGDATPVPPQTTGALAGYFAGHPELEGTGHLCGEPVDVPGLLAAARKSSSPDPMVFVEVGGKTFRTTLAPGQFTPVWSFPIVVTISPDSDEPVRFTVVDWDGPGQLDIIGLKVIPAKELLANPTVELPRFGSVTGFIVTHSAAPTQTRSRVAISARNGWTDTGLRIVAGQEVAIRAAGEVCSKGSDRSRCAGPEGQARTSDDNLPGFEARGHGALVGGLGDTRFFIGREQRFVAPSSGPLLLGVNDGDYDNNRGEVEVQIDLR